MRMLFWRLLFLLTLFDLSKALFLILISGSRPHPQSQYFRHMLNGTGLPAGSNALLELSGKNEIIWVPFVYN